MWAGEGVVVKRASASEQGQRGFQLAAAPGAHLPIGPWSAEMGPFRARLYQGRGEAVSPEDSPIRVSTAPAPDAPERSAAVAVRLD